MSQTTIKLIHTQRVLSPTQITLADYVINPYRGCEFGCLYCYSQDNKNIDQTDFGKTLAVKINAPDLLEKELRFKKPHRVLLGSTTECFPYQERNFKITEKILSILNKHGIAYTILSKSSLLAHSLPLIAQNPKNKIYFTFNLHADNLIQILEPLAPPLSLRLKVLDKILAAGINVRIHIGPYIPFISQLKEILALLPSEIKEIDIELYHNKQGNFEGLIKTLEKNGKHKIIDRLRGVYETRGRYDTYSRYLESTIRGLQEKYQILFYYIVPDFDTFYTNKIDYEQPLGTLPSTGSK